MLAKPEVPKVVLATRDDEEELMAICRLLHKENGMATLSENKVRSILHRAFDRQGGIIGVIRGPQRIEGVIYLLLTSQWYTEDSHLEELFSIVHPEHRKSGHAETLVEFAKSMSEMLTKCGTMRIPLIIGILTNQRMAGKVRLYRRALGWPSGALFAYNANWTNEPAAEDFWSQPFPEKGKRSDDARKRHNATRTAAWKQKKSGAI